MSDTSTTAPSAEPPAPLPTLSEDEATRQIVALFGSLSSEDMQQMRPQMQALDRDTRWTLVTLLLDESDRGNLAGMLRIFKNRLADEERTPQRENTVDYYISQLER